MIAAPLFLLSAANLENFLWAFQVQFVLVFFAASLACVALLQESSSHRLPWLTLTIVMGFVATFSLGNGVLIWPILVGLTILGGLGWRVTLIVTVAGLCIGGLCLSSFTPVPIHASPVESLHHPLTVLRYAALYLSGPFGHLFGHKLGIALGSLGMMLTVSFALEAIRSHGQLPAARLVLLGITGFVVASAFVTALGRINFPSEQALSGRYFTPVLIYWIVTIVSCLVKRSPLFWWRRPVFSLGLGLLAILSATLVPQQFAEVRRWAVRTNNIQVGTMALVVNVQDDDAVRFFIRILLYPGAAPRCSARMLSRSTAGAWLSYSAARLEMRHGSYHQKNAQEPLIQRQHSPLQQVRGVDSVCLAGLIGKKQLSILIPWRLFQKPTRSSDLAPSTCLRLPWRLKSVGGSRRGPGTLPSVFKRSRLLLTLCLLRGASRLADLRVKCKRLL